jgi:hypothetical protein
MIDAATMLATIDEFPIHQRLSARDRRARTVRTSHALLSQNNEAKVHQHRFVRRCFLKRRSVAAAAVPTRQDNDGARQRWSPDNDSLQVAEVGAELR